jgi:hypothetical protein
MDTSSDPLCFVENVMDEDEEDEENEGKWQSMLMLALIATTAINNPCFLFFVQDRLEYTSHVKQLFLEGPLAFSNFYRMGNASFHILCKLIDAHVSVDSDMSQ